MQEPCVALDSEAGGWYSDLITRLLNLSFARDDAIILEFRADSALVRFNTTGKTVRSSSGMSSSAPKLRGAVV
jgi:hypothetical protein